MEIKLSIQDMAIKRGITTAYQLQKALDAYPSEAAKLWKGEVKQVSLTMLGRLCDALDCAPCDLLVKAGDETAATGTTSAKAAAKSTASKKTKK